MDETVHASVGSRWGRWLAVLAALVVGLAGTQLLPSLSAGANALALGHYQGSGVHRHADHGQHAGDMPSLEARTDGGAVLSFETDQISVDEIVGRTVIVHQLADNFANIPARYGTPDTATLGTGDAGRRRYCGEIGRGGAG